MPDHMNHLQSMLDLQASGQGLDDTMSTTCIYDAFPGDRLVGIALGSPRDSPLPPLPLDGAERCVPPKHKISRWKSFGSLFVKKGIARSASASPSFSTQYPQSRGPTSIFTFQDRNVDVSSVAYRYRSRAESPQGSSARTPSMSPKTTSTARSKTLRRKMSFKRSNSHRKGVQDASHPNRNRSHTTPLPRLEADSSKLQFNGEPLLQVEIPSVSEMERYSVMFSDLLQPPTASSLLFRRQAHLEELYTGISAKEEVDLVSISIVIKNSREHLADSG